MPNGTVLRNSVKPSHKEYGFGASMNGWLPSSWGPMSLLDKVPVKWGLVAATASSVLLQQVRADRPSVRTRLRGISPHSIWTRPPVAFILFGALPAGQRLELLQLLRKPCWARGLCA